LLIERQLDLRHQQIFDADVRELRAVTKEQEVAWRSEFERLGETLVYENVKQGAIYNDEAKRQAAFRWPGEQAAARRARDEKTFRYARWTFFTAIAAAFVGLIAAWPVIKEWLVAGIALMLGE
jgi:hypothetical protein